MVLYFPSAWRFTLQRFKLLEALFFEEFLAPIGNFSLRTTFKQLGHWSYYESPHNWNVFINVPSVLSFLKRFYTLALLLTRCILGELYKAGSAEHFQMDGTAASRHV